MFNFSNEDLVVAKALEIVESRLRKPETQFFDKDDVEAYLVLKYAGKEREEFNVLFLDARNRLICAETMFMGSASQTPVYVGEVAKQALRLNAHSVIVAHNHPSGDSTPSPQDYHMTEQVKRALATVEVEFIDHLVVGGKHVHSIEHDKRPRSNGALGGIGPDELMKLLGLRND